MRTIAPRPKLAARAARVLGFAFAVVLVGVGCSSSSNCPTPAPGTGDSCSGNATCAYGPVSCACNGSAWQCDLPFSPEITPGGDDDAGDGVD
jgi:hypothetical protein